MLPFTLPSRPTVTRLRKSDPHRHRASGGPRTQSMANFDEQYAEESDGVILAVRWLLEGTTRPGGMLGDGPDDKAVSVMGMRHMRFDDDYVVEEWTLFDEVGVLAQACLQ